VGNNALSLRCEHCGIEHMIRREAGGVFLESYARCPICNRNDRSEKVTAILSSQTQNTQGFTYQNQVSTESYGNTIRTVNSQVPVPIQTSQMSELAKRLLPPPKPTINDTVPVNTSNKAIILALLTSIIGGGCLLLSFFVFFSSFSETQPNIGKALIYIFISLVIIGLAVLLFNSAQNERNSNKAIEAEAANKSRELQIQKYEWERKWNLAMQRWNQLYYCARDDCVFLPGTNTCAHINDMVGYLYKA